VTMTRTGKRATKEQHAAAEHLGLLDDSLARWVQSTGPIDAYDAHLSTPFNGLYGPYLESGQSSGVPVCVARR
jgi:hypothetical protein